MTDELEKILINGFYNNDFGNIDECLNLTFLETKDIIFSVLDKVHDVIRPSNLKLLFYNIDITNSSVSDYLDKNFLISCLVFEFWHKSFHIYFESIDYDEFFDKIFEDDRLEEDDFISLYKTLYKNNIKLDNSSIEKFLSNMKYDDDTYHTLFNSLYKLYNEISSIPSHIIPDVDNRRNNLDLLNEYRKINLESFTNLKITSVTIPV